MDHRLYVLITRSAVLLIVALLIAPVWDSWRYRGLMASGGAGLPVGVIMSAPRRQAATPAGLPATAAPPGAIAAGRARPADTAAFTTAAGPSPAFPASPRSAPIPGTSPGFEAWTAREQVDPFWDGDETPRPALPPADEIPAAAGPGAAPDDSLAEDAGRLRGDGPGAERDRAGDRRRGPEGDPSGFDRDEDGSGGEGPADDDRPAADPGDEDDAGWVAALRPVAAEDAGRDPEPDPPASGDPATGRVYAPRVSPGDPEPTPVAVPTVAVIVATPEVLPDDPVLVAIRIEDADQVTSLPFHLIFDPSVLEFIDSQAGSALASHDPVLLASVSPNRPGDLAVGLSLIEAAGTFSGTGEVVTLRFRAVAPGRSDLSFSRATLRGPMSSPVEVRFAGGYVTVR